MQQNVGMRKHDAWPVAAARQEAPAGKTRTNQDDGLLATAGPIMAVAYAIALTIAAFTFAGSGEAMLAIGVCAAYVTMFFGVPAVMVRIRNKRDARYRPDAPERRAEKVAVFTGTIHRWEALLQMIIVPLGVVFAFAAFSVIWLTVGS